MMQKVIASLRHYTTNATKAAYNKETLMRLRKSTGYPLQNCRKAVEQFGDDLPNAEKWLRQKALEEGWSKMATVRKTAAGLIGLKTDGRRGLMLEINCETDFVARNENFQKLTSQICQQIFEYGDSMNGERSISMEGTFRKCFVDADQAASIPMKDLEQSKTIADLVASYVGQIGEKILLRRALYLESIDSSCTLIGYAHPKCPAVNGIFMGQLGTLVAFSHDAQHSVGSAGNPSAPNAQFLGNMICQHIVGMNPKTVGTFEEGENPTLNNETSASNEQSDENWNESNVTKLDGDETELLKQDFLLQPEMKFGQFLNMNGAKVYDFVRFKCGEE